MGSSGIKLLIRDTAFAIRMGSFVVEVLLDGSPTVFRTCVARGATCRGCPDGFGTLSFLRCNVEQTTVRVCFIDNVEYSDYR